MGRLSRRNQNDLLAVAPLLEVVDQGNREAEVEGLRIAGFDVSIRGVDGSNRRLEDYEANLYREGSDSFFCEIAGIDQVHNIVKTRPCLKAGSSLVIRRTRATERRPQELEVVCAKHATHRVGRIPPDVAHELIGEEGSALMVRTYTRRSQRVGALIVGSMTRRVVRVLC